MGRSVSRVGDGRPWAFPIENRMPMWVNTGKEYMLLWKVE